MYVRDAALAVLLAALPAFGGTVRSLTDLPRPDVGLAAIDDASTGIWAIAAADPLGTNPWGVPQIFRWDPATGAVAQVTFFEEGVVEPPGSPILSIPAVVPGVSVTDDGQWIAFLSRGNLTGGNPDRNVELYLMRSDGGILRQLTSTDDPAATIYRFAISGFGFRVVFLHDGELTVANPGRAVLAYKVEANGTALRRLSSSAPTRGASWVSVSDDGARAVVCEESPTGRFEVYAVDVVPGTSRALTSLEQYCRVAEISGNGTIVAFETNATGLLTGAVSYPQCQGLLQVAIVPWIGGLPRDVSGVCACQGSLAPGRAYGPTLSDDGSWVFFGSDECAWQIFKSRTDGSSKVQLTVSWYGVSCPWAVAPGGSGRLAALCSGDAFWSPGQNPDGGNELHSTTQTGSAPLTDARQLSNVRSGSSHAHAITPDGSVVVFASNAQPDGTPPSSADQIYRVSTAGGTPVAVASFTQGSVPWVGVTDDGQTIVFLSDADPLDLDVVDIQALHAVAADGTDLRRLTPAGATISLADVAGGGSLAIFSTSSDMAPGGAGLHSVRLDGTTVTWIAPTTSHAVIDATGTWAAYKVWNGIFRVRADGSAPPSVAVALGGQEDVYRLGISGDGGKIAFSSRYNVGGFNPDGNGEVFLWEAATGALRALAPTTTGNRHEFSLSRDGTRVAAVGLLESNGAGELSEIVRISVETDTVERIDGLRPSEATGRLATDLGGEKVTFSGTGRASGRNLDWSREIFLIDLSAAQGLAVSPGSGPTTITWDVESGPATYDVIRGDVAALAHGEGGEVDLGVVTCLENDSADATTRGNEDTATPAPGEAWFFLLRGAMQTPPGPGSYGSGSGGGERTPAAGDCSTIGE